MGEGMFDVLVDIFEEFLNVVFVCLYFGFVLVFGVGDEVW